MRSICPAVTREQSPALPRNLHGDWTSLGQHESHPEFPIVTGETHHNSKKPRRFPHHCIALSCYSVSREIPRSVLKFEMVLDTLDATQKVPRHTGLTGEEHRFLDTSLDEVYLPCSDLRAIPSSPSQPKWKIGLSWPTQEVVTRESRRNWRKTTWFPHHSKMKPFTATVSQEKSNVPS